MHRLKFLQFSQSKRTLSLSETCKSLYGQFIQFNTKIDFGPLSHLLVQYVIADYRTHVMLTKTPTVKLQCLLEHSPINVEDHWSFKIKFLLPFVGHLKNNIYIINIYVY